MGAEQSKLTPDERARIEEAADKETEEDIRKWAEEYRQQHPERKRKRKRPGTEQAAPPVEDSVVDKDLEPGEVATDAESDSIAVPIRSASSSQAAPQATDLLASFNPRKEKESKRQSIQDQFVGFGNETSSTATAHRPAKTRPRVDTSSDSIKNASRNNSATFYKSPASANDSPIDSNKRPAPESSAGDEKKLSASALSGMKIPKRTSIASPQSPDGTEGHEKSANSGERPPTWYRETRPPTTRNKKDAEIDPLLNSLRSEIKHVVSLTASNNTKGLEKSFKEVRNKLHTVIFLEPNPGVLKFNRMLHDADGLPQIFDARFSNGVKWPFDIRADARELYNKWYRRDFKTDIMRGIDFSLTVKGTRREGGDSIDPKHEGVVEARRPGNNGLVNGQWWPFQICALRDGAHGSIQGGISGAKGQGAFSCILSGGVDSKGQPYPDKDEGDIVWYCGTDSDNGEFLKPAKIQDMANIIQQLLGEPTAYTSRMLESVNNEPVRLIRSHNAHSRFSPEYGFRYDGLYNVVGSEELDPKGSTRQRHRFKLVRVGGQDPIRGGSGPEKRPTMQEINEYQKHQRNSGKKG